MSSANSSTQPLLRFKVSLSRSALQASAEGTCCTKSSVFIQGGSSLVPVLDPKEKTQMLWGGHCCNESGWGGPGPSAQPSPAKRALEVVINTPGPWALHTQSTYPPPCSLQTTSQFQPSPEYDLPYHAPTFQHHSLIASRISFLSSASHAALPPRRRVASWSTALPRSSLSYRTGARRVPDEAVWA